MRLQVACITSEAFALSTRPLICLKEAIDVEPDIEFRANRRNALGLIYRKSAVMKSNFRRAVASHASSTLNYRPISLNAQPCEKKWVVSEEGDYYTRKRPYTLEMSNGERRQLRKRLRRDLRTVQVLSSRIEVRELQVRRQSQSTGMHLSMSDAQFSVNDVRSTVGGKEVTSQLQQGVRMDDDTPNGQNRHVFENSRSFRGQSFAKRNQKIQYKEKLSPSVDSKVSLSDCNKPLARANVATTRNLEFFAPCKAVLKKLMGHRHGWVFNTPVDAVKMGLPDYHSVIKKPMDLGTVMGRLERKEYSSPQQFASDVKLTFKNAMTYNPGGSDVHYVADELYHLFEDSWKVLCGKLEINGSGLSEREVLDNQIEKQSKMKTAGRCEGGPAAPAQPGTFTKRKTPSTSLANQKGPGRQSVRGPTKKSDLNQNSVPPASRTLAKDDIGAQNKVTEPGKLSHLCSNSGQNEVNLTARANQVEMSAQGKSPQPEKSSVISQREPEDNYVYDNEPNAPSHEQSPASIKSNSNCNRSDPTSALVKQKSPSKPKHIDGPLPMETKLLDQPDSKFMPKREMSYEEKASMINRLQSLPGRMQDGIIQLMKERNPSLTQSDDEIEVDIDSFDNDTLWELDEQINKCLSTVDKNPDAQAEEPLPKNDALETYPQQQEAHLYHQVAAEDEDEDVDIMDDVSQSNAYINLTGDAGNEKQSSSSCSSSSESGSPSDSDSGSSSGSEGH